MENKTITFTNYILEQDVGSISKESDIEKLTHEIIQKFDLEDGWIDYISEMIKVNILYKRILPRLYDSKDKIYGYVQEDRSYLSVIEKIYSFLDKKIDISLIDDILVDKVQEDCCDKTLVRVQTNINTKLNKLFDLYEETEGVLRLPTENVQGTIVTSDSRVIKVTEYFVPYLKHGQIDKLEIKDVDKHKVGATIHNPSNSVWNTYGYANWLWGEIMVGRQPAMTQTCSDHGTAMLMMPLTYGAPHSSDYCTNNSKWSIEMYGENSQNEMKLVERNTAAFIKWVSQKYKFGNFADICHKEVYNTACPAYSLQIHGSVTAVKKYINDNIPGGAGQKGTDYCSGSTNPNPPGSGTNMTGRRYLISGGNFTSNNYLGYTAPGGSKKLTYVVDSGQYWADEYIYNGAQWFGLCDDAFRFFFIKSTDCSNKRYVSSHKYPSVGRNEDKDKGE